MARDEKQLVEKNIELSAEFSRYLFDHPEMDDAIPPEAEIIFLPEFDTELKKFNLELGRKMESTGKEVVYIRIQKLKPRLLSRMEGVNVETQGTGFSA